MGLSFHGSRLAASTGYAVVYLLGIPPHHRDGKLQKSGRLRRLRRLERRAAMDCPRGHLDSRHCRPMLGLNSLHAPKLCSEDGILTS